MPKPFSEKERSEISKSLKAVAFKSLLSKGVKKTTVDDLVKAVNIPKGTFYLFFESKEILLYEAMMDFEEETHNQLSSSILNIQNNFNVESLSSMIMDFFKIGYESGFAELLLKGEIDILLRKLPDEIVKSHIEKDDDFLSVFKFLFPNLTEKSLSNYSGAFRALFFTVAYKREIGENYYEVLELMAKSLITQMFMENKKW